MTEESLLRPISATRLDALGAINHVLEGSGVGAWSFGYYKYGFKAGDDPRKRAGILAVKRALIAQGYSKGIDLGMFVFGDAVRNRTKEFQSAHGLTVDGVVGPTTARHLWRHYVGAAEGARSIPNHWVGRIATGESNNDPVAEGVLDPSDEGIVQIHLPFHPDVSLDAAWDPAFSLDWAARHLAADDAFTRSWTGAVAAWNIGRTYAKAWVDADYPVTGGPPMGTNSAGETIYAFERATKYVAYVAALPF